MTPGARVAAAITILDQINDGVAAERALTGWARASRFAGSKDRAAIRDHVFDVLRTRRSLGVGDGRQLMQQLLQRDGADVAAFFDGQGHAPEPLTTTELARLAQPAVISEAAAHDVPEWLWPQWCTSLGGSAQAAARALQRRADVFVRLNTRRAQPDQVIAMLADDEIVAECHVSIPACLRVTGKARRLKSSAAYLEGLIELQDAASQWAVHRIKVPQGGRVLDYCAGGGGKALAFADQQDVSVFAHDIAPHRMNDLPVRAARAQVTIKRLATSELPQHAPFDVVFCDAPCSGSGTWRRTPDAKWRLTSERLAELTKIQAGVLDQAASLVTDTGCLAYATCSVLADENSAVIEAFITRHPCWQVQDQHLRVPGSDGDGFFLCIMVQK